MRVLSSAATVKVKIARSTSVRAALMGLPASWAQGAGELFFLFADSLSDLAQHALPLEGG